MRARLAFVMLSKHGNWLEVAPHRQECTGEANGRKCQGGPACWGQGEWTLLDGEPGDLELVFIRERDKAKAVCRELVAEAGHTRFGAHLDDAVQMLASAYSHLMRESGRELRERWGSLPKRIHGDRPDQQRPATRIDVTQLLDPQIVARCTVREWLRGGFE